MYKKLEKIYSSEMPSIEDIIYFLSTNKKEEIEALYLFADKVRHEFCGDEIFLRGIVEFSNYCKNKCFYCGINEANKKLKRYRLSEDEILESIERIYLSKIKTVVLQSGEDDGISSDKITDIIKKIKSKIDIAITLAVGERSIEEYKLWKNAGADRFLLKIETSNKALYESMHPGMSFDNRIQCLKNLKLLGFETGSGIMIGLKNQTLEDIANDIIFFKKMNFDMIGIGPFIPHIETEFKNEHPGRADITLKTLALTRIVTRNAHLPATTSIGSLGGYDYRLDALKAGANVLMPNFTPQPYKNFYEIYPGKKCINEPGGNAMFYMEETARSIGRYINYSKGRSLKNAKNS